MVASSATVTTIDPVRALAVSPVTPLIDSISEATSAILAKETVCVVRQRKRLPTA